MNELKLFSFEENQVRVTIDEDNNPWFVATDVARVLGYKNVYNAIPEHCDDYSKQVVVDKAGRKQLTWVIPESDVYNLIFGSKMPNAKKFKRWVTREVLPSIRKTGGYSQYPELPDFNNPVKAARAWADEAESKMIAEKKIKELEPKVDYHDEVLQSTSTYIITQIAKELGMSAVKLNRELHKRGIQYKRNDTWFLYAKYQACGYTDTRTHVYDKDGKVGTTMQMLWTEKGRKYIHSLFHGLARQTAMELHTSEREL